MSDYKKEIGGYMELEEFCGREYHESAVKLNSGRHCLEYILRARKIKKIYLPYFLCDSVRKICVKCDVECKFYHIDGKFNPILSNIEPDSYIYIVNYYGQKSEADILGFKNTYKNIIVDNAQAFFSMPACGIDTLYTCRKYFGVSDGGYLYTDVKLDIPLETDVSYQRMEFVLGRYELNASAFYEQASNNNKVFENENLKLMSKLTQNLLKRIDYNFAINKRNANFLFLYDSLKNINKLDLIIPNGAFMFPLYIENGARLKEKLIQNKIYVPTLWPDVFETCERGCLEYELAENILPLPVDHRYNVEDMKYILNFVE